MGWWSWDSSAEQAKRTSRARFPSEDLSGGRKMVTLTGDEAAWRANGYGTLHAGTGLREADRGREGNGLTSTKPQRRLR